MRDRILDLRNRADMESLLLDIPITSCDADGVLRKAQFMLGMLRSLPNAVRRILVSIHCSDVDRASLTVLVSMILVVDRRAAYPRKLWSYLHNCSHDGRPIKLHRSAGRLGCGCVVNLRRSMIHMKLGV